MIAIVNRDDELQMHVSRTHHPHHLYGLLMLGALLMMVFFGPHARSAGLDNVTVSLSSETVNTDAQVTVAFAVGNLSDGDDITIYLGETTGSDEWQDDSITTAHIACSDDGSGETYTASAVTAATATTPFNVSWTATTVGSGAATVTCLIGDGGSNNPNNPVSADGYSVAVVTTNDSGAGIVYVGNANDITVTAQTLPNLSLTVDNPDGSACTTSSGLTGCDLGVVLTSVVNTGNYDVNVGTNATNGATLRVQQDQDMTSGGDTISPVVENTTVTAGMEAYGIAVAADASWTETGDFTDDDTPLPSSATTVVTNAAPIDSTGDDVTITHRIAVGSSTVAGNYTQVTTWTATANF